MLEGKIHRISPTGKLVASATKEGLLHLRRPQTPTDEFTLAGHEDQVTGLEFSPGGEQLISIGKDQTARIWDLTTRQGRVLLESKHELTSAAFSADVTQVAVGDTLGFIRVFPAQGGTERILEGHVGNVESLIFFADGKQLVSGGRDHTIRIWDLATGKGRTIDASGLGIEVILFSNDGKTMYSLGSESPIRQWDIATGAALRVLRGHEAPVKHISLSPDGTRLASASIDGVVRLWDLASGQSRSLEGHRGSITWLSFSRNGDRLVSAGSDGTVRIWYDDLPSDADGLRAWMTNTVPDKMAAPHD
jgi:WD40 repeat protein